MIIKTTTLILSIGLLGSTAMTAVAAVPDGFEGFKSRIHPENRIKSETTAQATPIEQGGKLAEKVCQSEGISVFYGWNNQEPSAPALVMAKENPGEKMDSIVGHYLDGRLMSKQEFVYTETGRPLTCKNYLPDFSGTSYQLDGYYAYEYDKEERVISAEKVSASGSSMRVEYQYEANTPVYSVQIAYLPDGNGGWKPYQKGEYTFDANYNTTGELFSLWNEDAEVWTPVMKNEAEYDDQDRLTAYFPYLWDETTAAWVGNKNEAYEGQRFSYTENGDDAQQIDYTWENNDWLEYKHIDYYYNEDALLTQRDELYWNRANQDWSGGDTYGQWSEKKYNSRSINEYDENGRIVLNNYYRLKKTVDYVNTYRTIYEYSELENGEKQVITTGQNIASDGTATNGSREIVRNNRFGGETYYAILSSNSDGGFDMKEEENRYYIPDTNWYVGYESFRYENGVKKAVSKEEFTYPEDFDVESEYQTPIEGRHWVSGVDGLVLKTLDCFSWGPRGVMTEYISYDCLSGTPLRVYGWDVEYDFTADCSNIFMWPDANKGEVFYQNKNISSNEYYNPATANGVDEWDNSISGHFDYYYSERKSSGITAAEVSKDAEIVDRFDIMGRRLSAPTEGVNIVVYSDGSVVKTIGK